MLRLCSISCLLLVLACDQPQTINRAPVAFAGYDRQAELGSTLILDGSQSHDPDGNSLSYLWTVQTVDGQRQALESAAVVRYTPLLEGSYLFFLRVDDGTKVSPPDIVAIQVHSMATEAALVARAGSCTNITPGSVGFLDGGASSGPAGVALFYSWTLVDWPEGAIDGEHYRWEVSTETPAEATFYHLDTQLLGAFVFALRVSDGFVESDPDYVTIGVGLWGDAVWAEVLEPPRSALGSDGEAPLALDVRLRPYEDAAGIDVEWWVLAAPDRPDCPKAGDRLLQGISVRTDPPVTMASLNTTTTCAGTLQLLICPVGQMPPCGSAPCCSAIGERAPLSASCCRGLADRATLIIEEFNP